MDQTGRTDGGIHADKAEEGVDPKNRENYSDSPVAD
jgi:hypothetical protein